jgi:hypothetical protein
MTQTDLAIEEQAIATDHIEQRVIVRRRVPGAGFRMTHYRAERKQMVRI